MRAFEAIALATLLGLGWMTYSLFGSIEYDAKVTLPSTVLPELKCGAGEVTCERVVHLRHNALKCTLTGRCLELRP